MQKQLFSSVLLLGISYFFNVSILITLEVTYLTCNPIFFCRASNLFKKSINFMFYTTGYLLFCLF